MREFVRGLAVVVCALVIPHTALAQAVIAGAVKDTSGAVLPGVTVEAASPALIEKVRNAVSDGNGVYRIEIFVLEPTRLHSRSPVLRPSSAKASS